MDYETMPHFSRLHGYGDHQAVRNDRMWPNEVTAEKKRIQSQEQNCTRWIRVGLACQIALPIDYFCIFKGFYQAPEPETRVRGDYPGVLVGKGWPKTTIEPLCNALELPPEMIERVNEADSDRAAQAALQGIATVSYTHLTLPTKA